MDYRAKFTNVNEEGETSCCDGTGWTGVEGQPCAEHYEPLDSIWRGHSR